MRGCCMISFKLYWEFRQGRPNRRSSYSSTTGFKDDCCCSFNMQRLNCCAFPGSHCHNTHWTHQRCAVSLYNTPVLHAPVLQSVSLLALWPIHVLCNRRCYSAAVFCDVELATIWKFVWHVSAALPPHLLLGALYVETGRQIWGCEASHLTCISCLGEHSSREYYYSTWYLTGPWITG